MNKFLKILLCIIPITQTIFPMLLKKSSGIKLPGLKPAVEVKFDSSTKYSPSTIYSFHDSCHIEKDKALLHPLHNKTTQEFALLLSQGADPDLEQNETTPLDFAIKSKSPNKVKLLLQYKASIKNDVLLTLTSETLTNPTAQENAKNIQIMKHLSDYGADKKTSFELISEYQNQTTASLKKLNHAVLADQIAISDECPIIIQKHDPLEQVKKRTDSPKRTFPSSSTPDKFMQFASILQFQDLINEMLEVLK